MKKILGILLFASAVTSLAACGKKSNDATKNPEVKFDEKEYYEPQISIPKVYLTKGAHTNHEALSVHLLKYAKVTFEAQHVNDDYTIEVDLGNLIDNEGNIAEEGHYIVKFIIKYGEYTKVQQSNVEVVTYAVLGVEETAKIPTINPKFGMTELADFTEGIEFTDTDTTVIDIETAVQSGKIVIDDSTVRYAVPGQHLVKYIIKTESGITQYYYREVTVGKAETPTKAQFEEYFTFENSAMGCRKDSAVVFPKILYFPSEFIDGDRKVKVEKYKQYACDFKNETTELNDKFRNVEVVIVAEGHEMIGDAFFAVSQWQENSKPSIKSIYLPETLISIRGQGVLAGTKVKTLIIPSSVMFIDLATMENMWDLENVVFLGMPTSSQKTPGFQRGGTTGPIVEKLLTLYGRLNIYFRGDYVMGVSSEAWKNEEYKAIYLWARETDHTNNLKKYIGFSKIILK